MSKFWRFLAAMVVLALLVAACSGDDDESSQSAADDGGVSSDFEGADDSAADGGGDESFDEDLAGAQVGEPGDVERAEESAAEDAATGGAAEVPETLQPVDLGRDIIFTAQMVIEAEDVGAARQQALLAIEGLGGLLFGEESSTEPRPRTTLTFKVAPADFQTALGRLGEVGEVRDQVVTADDVTERVVDLESRIRTAEASVERLRGFLEGATDLESVAQLEGQLLERETQLETLNGQLRTIQNRVDLATIVVTIVEADQPVPDADIALTRAVYTGQDGGQGCAEAEGVEVDADEEVTVCWTITNDGEALLADVALADRGLDLELADMLVVEGELDEIMAPGAIWVLAYETVLTDDVFGRAVVQATPVDEEGEPRGEPVSDEVSTGIVVNENDALPGFVDALAASWDALKWLLSVVLLAVAALLPFIWVVLLVAAIIWWLRRRRPATPRPTPPPPVDGAPQPTPPPPADGTPQPTPPPPPADDMAS